MRKLTKGKHKMIFGVCSGIAEYTGINVTLIRIATVLGVFFSASILFWIYLLLGILLPPREDE
jgi:phage shock protein PspC (stress-responsive transcriptional regulator)